MTSNSYEVRSSNGVLLAIHCPLKDGGNGVDWFGNQECTLQAARMRFGKEKSFKPHAHLPRMRKIPQTQEAMVVISGALHCDIYDWQDRKVDWFVLKPGDLGLFLDGGHGYTVVEDGTVFYEIKHGPFISVEKDKRFL